MNLFEDWFRRIIVPYRRKIEGTMALIGDNLPAHISVDVTDILETESTAIHFLAQKYFSYLIFERLRSHTDRCCPLFALLFILLFLLITHVLS